MNVLLVLSLLTLALQDAPALRRATSLQRAGKWAQAEEVYEEITTAHPQSGEAWFGLASCRHAQEDWSGAAEANLRAAEFPAYRATALYNLGCAQALGGELELAAQSVERAVEAGFLDFDLLASDPDLDAVRAQQRLPEVRRQEYRELKARNGIRLRYQVIEPKGIDPQRAYPALVAFSPGSGPRSTDWMIEELWAGVDEQEEWIVINLVAPQERGWHTHPSHHALEDLLRRLQKEYVIEGEAFHLFGFASGCRAATTYSGMSRKYFQSMTLVSSSAWGSYDDSDWRRWRKMPVHQIVGENSHTLELDKSAGESLEAAGVRSSLTIVPGDGLLTESLRGRELLAEIARAQLRAE